MNMFDPKSLPFFVGQWFSTFINNRLLPPPTKVILKRTSVPKQLKDEVTIEMHDLKLIPWASQTLKPP